MKFVLTINGNMKKKKDKSLTICVDFDGTCVTHEYPLIGQDIGAVPILQELVNRGHKLILFTMRHGQELKDAENWFKDNNIPLYASQINPSQKFWTKSNKCYANVYLDDAALGCPLIHPEGEDARPYVDWNKVKELLIKD